MATYKVLQDIEAEDKLLGPLTLKQFIFAIIFAAIGFVTFKLATTPELSIIRWPFVVLLLIPLVIFGFLAAPISRDQPNDIWLLARIRFLIKPHARIWNQDGISQLVTITVPKKLERALTNGLAPHEVESRLNALASTLDSRGWAIKNVDVNMFAQPDYFAVSDESDRLIAPSSLPATEPVIDIKAADDMLDAISNPTAQHLDQMVQASTAAHRQQLLASVQQPSAASSGTVTPPADYWFLNQPANPTTPEPGLATFQKSTVVAPGSTDAGVPQPTAEERALISKIEAEKAKAPEYTSHLKRLQPLGGQRGAGSGQSQTTVQAPSQPLGGTTLPPVAPAAQNPRTQAPPPSAPTSNPAILNLANNDDLNVATIARQAQRISESDGEVTISLH